MSGGWRRHQRSSGAGLRRALHRTTGSPRPPRCGGAMDSRQARALALVAAWLAAAALAGCKRDRGDVGVRDRASTERAQKQAMATLGDESVIAAMRTPDTLG